MKIFNGLLKRKIFRRGIAILVVTFTFLGGSFVVYQKSGALGNGPPMIVIGGIQKVDSAETAWAGVRHMATMSRSLISFADTLIKNLNSTGLLSRTVTFSTTFTDPASSITYNVKIQSGGNFPVTPTHEAANRTYSNGFIMCNGTTVALQLFFDDATSPTAGDGVLLRMKPKQLSPTTFTGNDIIIETAMSGSTGTRTQVISWNGGPMVTSGPVDNARIVVQEAGAGSSIQVRGVARLGNSAVCAGGNSDYYALAFIANTTSPNESTAAFGLMDGGTYPPTAGNACAVASSLNYATFTSSGFVADGVASGSIPSGYPAAADVDTVYTSLASSPTTMANIDAISVSFDSDLTCP